MTHIFRNLRKMHGTVFIAKYLNKTEKLQPRNGLTFPPTTARAERAS